MFPSGDRWRTCPRSSSGTPPPYGRGDLSCHSTTYPVPPITSLADSRWFFVSGTKHRCICGLRSSMCTTAEKMFSAPTSLLKNLQRPLEVSPHLFPEGAASDSPVWAVTMVSMNFTLSPAHLELRIFPLGLFDAGLDLCVVFVSGLHQVVVEVGAVRVHIRGCWHSVASFVRDVSRWRRPARLFVSRSA